MGPGGGVIKDRGSNSEEWHVQPVGGKQLGVGEGLVGGLGGHLRVGASAANDLTICSPTAEVELLVACAAKQLGDDEPRKRSEERRVGKECRSRGSPYH